MNEQSGQQTCFNCGRSDEMIPLLVWHYQKRPLIVCSECMPMLIHKWPQTAARLADQPPANK
jgi:hypothetical protein